MKQTEDREAVYDAQIAPLMTQIIAVCKAHDIPVVASFQLSQEPEPLVCSTVIVPAWADETLLAIGNCLGSEWERGKKR